MKLAAKLNLKGTDTLTLLNAPDGFDIAVLETAKVNQAVNDSDRIRFALAFVSSRAQIAEFAALLCPKAEGDAMLWFAYPKKSSRRYRCDFSRDVGWEPLGVAGYEPVRMIAIDHDWAALRFRHVDYIKQLRRDPARALSARGRELAGKD